MKLLQRLLDFGAMGLEIGMQRVDEDGNLSLEPYPSAIGDEKTNPWITTMIF